MFYHYITYWNQSVLSHVSLAFIYTAIFSCTLSLYYWLTVDCSRKFWIFPVDSYSFKVYKGNRRTMCEIRSKLTIKEHGSEKCIEGFYCFWDIRKKRDKTWTQDFSFVLGVVMNGLTLGKFEFSIWNHSFLYVRKIFRETDISDPLIRTRTCAYQRVRNISFCGKICVRIK